MRINRMRQEKKQREYYICLYQNSKFFSRFLPLILLYVSFFVPLNSKIDLEWWYVLIWPKGVNELSHSYTARSELDSCLILTEFEPSLSGFAKKIEMSQVSYNTGSVAHLWNLQVLFFSFSLFLLFLLGALYRLFFF